MPDRPLGRADATHGEEGDQGLRRETLLLSAWPTAAMEPTTNTHRIIRAGDPDSKMFRALGESEIASQIETDAAFRVSGPETPSPPRPIGDPGLEAIGRLTAGIAHDFNNLLAVILACSHELEQQLPRPELRQRATEIRAAAQRGAGLTQQLLSHAGERRAERTVTDLNEATEEAVLLLRRTIGTQVSLRTEIASNLPRVLLAPGQVTQLIVNLATNARDAMTPGGGCLLIGTGMTAIGNDDPDLRPGWYVGLEVTDTGVGMDAETLRRAREPFFTTRREAGGSGLGLASVEAIAKAAGGDTRINSRPGVGTSVFVLLPAVTEHGRHLAADSTL